jgi:glycosyltransferase involved in cell wall biosynthesis
MTLFSRRYLKILRNNKIKILTFSNFHIDRLVTNKVDNDKIFKLNNYLEKTPTPEIKINLPQKYICFVGRASKEKGVHIIIEAFINSNLKDTKLLIVGNISADIETAKYSNYAEIEFKNQLKNVEVRFLMSKSRAVIMGSIAYEGHPVTLSEAIISNSVLIYPSFSGLDELMPSDYDYSYFHNDIEDLTRVMNLLNDEKTYSKNKSSLKVFKEKKYSEDLFFEQFQIALDCK